jgi:hypothetical protein
VNVYAPGATGNVAPIRTISGSKTGLQNVNAVAVGKNGKAYVSSTMTNSQPGCCITVYAKGANGNVAPRQSISGSKTQIDIPGGIAVDENENIYVSNLNSNSIIVFAEGATGNVAPIRVITGSKTKLDTPSDLAIR